jgi:hypothetical protein
MIFILKKLLKAMAFHAEKPKKGFNWIFLEAKKNMNKFLIIEISRVSCKRREKKMHCNVIQ